MSLAKGMKSRRGVGLMIALVCLAVVASALGWLLRAAIAERRALERAQWRRQAGWLAQSGLDRAAARLARNRSFRGETWTIPAAALRGSQGGRVTIEVQTPAGRPGVRQVRVTAFYPDRPYDRAQSSRRALLSLSP
jgi:type II secretory pathway component PulK